MKELKEELQKLSKHLQINCTESFYKMWIEDTANKYIDSIKEPIKQEGIEEIPKIKAMTHQLCEQCGVNYIGYPPYCSVGCYLKLEN